MAKPRTSRPMDWDCAMAMLIVYAIAIVVVAPCLVVVSAGSSWSVGIEYISNLNFVKWALVLLAVGRGLARAGALRLCFDEEAFLFIEFRVSERRRGR